MAPCTLTEKNTFFVFLIAKQLQTSSWGIKCCLLLNLSKDFETNEKYDMSWKKKIKQRSIENWKVIIDLKTNKWKRESDCTPSQPLINYN